MILRRRHLLAGLAVASVLSTGAATAQPGTKLHEMDPQSCGAVSAVPETCVEVGLQSCASFGETLAEFVIQFKPGTKDISALWFRCAAGDQK